MKISPEPLAPLRKWRELWHRDSVDCETHFHVPGVPNLDPAKQPKRTGFGWLGHLFSRNSHR